MRVRRANKAFSIIEVMFAVIILGIGFMLVAALFPVAIQQTQATVDEVNARACAANGAMQVATLLRAVHPGNQVVLGTGGVYQRIANLPPTLPAVPAPPPPTEQQFVLATVNGMTFSQQDPRYAWSMLYSCQQPGVGQPWNLNLIVFGLRATNASQCTEMTAWSAPASPYDNAVIPCQVTIQIIPGSPARLVINAAGPNGAQAQEATISGAVVVREAAAAATAWQIVRLGNIPDDAPGAWEVIADPDDRPVTLPEANVPAYVIGRSLRYPDQPWGLANPREGACQVGFVQRMATQLP